MSHLEQFRVSGHLSLESNPSSEEAIINNTQTGERFLISQALLNILAVFQSCSDFKDASAALGITEPTEFSRFSSLCNNLVALGLLVPQGADLEGRFDAPFEDPGTLLSKPLVSFINCPFA